MYMILYTTEEEDHHELVDEINNQLQIQEKMKDHQLEARESSVVDRSKEGADISTTSGNSPRTTTYEGNQICCSTYFGYAKSI